MGAGQAHQTHPIRMARQDVPRPGVAGQRQKLGPQVGRKADRMAGRAIRGRAAWDGERILGPNRKAGFQVFGCEVGKIGQDHQNRRRGGQGIAAGDIPDDPHWNRVSWTTPKSVTVDAGREAANDRADVEMGLLSMSELYAQRGLDFRTEMDKRAADMVHIQNLAKQYGIPFELLFRPTNTPMGTVESVDEDEPAEIEEPASEDEPNS